MKTAQEKQVTHNLDKKTPALRLAMIGCGKLGAKLAHRLMNQGVEVVAVSRNRPKIDPIQTGTFQWIQADITQPYPQALPAVDHLVFCVSPDNYSPDAYQATYVEGLKQSINALSAPLQHLWVVSSTSVYGDQSGELDETSEIRPNSPMVQALADMEQWALSVTTSKMPKMAGERIEMPHLGGSTASESLKMAGERIETPHLVGSTTIVRLSGIYGPGREMLIAKTLAGIDPKPLMQVISNRIHEEDAVRLLDFLIQRSAQGQPVDSLYLGVDDHPCPLGEVVQWLRQRLKVTHLDASIQLSRKSDKVLSNQRIKNLGFACRYPSFVEGYNALLKEQPC